MKKFFACSNSPKFRQEWKRSYMRCVPWKIIVESRLYAKQSIWYTRSTFLQRANITKINLKKSNGRSALFMQILILQRKQNKKFKTNNFFSEFHTTRHAPPSKKGTRWQGKVMLYLLLNILLALLKVFLRIFLFRLVFRFRKRELSLVCISSRLLYEWSFEIPYLCCQTACIL